MFLEKLRLSLASPKNLWALLVLGLFCGLLAGTVIIVFRLVIELGQVLLLPGDGIDNYEALSAWERLLLSTSGGLLIGFLFQWSNPETRRVGVVHILESLEYFRAHLPWKNAVLQFFGAAISIICGHSVGREGPSVHLGAAAATLPGHWLGVPNNTLRVLIACGTATAIGVAFTTPLAGVIFAMEVVMMEYSIIGFTPVIFAAAIGTIVAYLSSQYAAELLNLSHLGLLQESLTLHQVSELRLLDEPTNYLYIGALGFLIGGLASLFTRGLGWLAQRGTSWPLSLRMGLAGLLVGLIGCWEPAVMGIGYDTMDAALLGKLGLTALIIIALAKLFATMLGLGLGLPGGLIGPTLVIGACAGGAFGLIGQTYLGLDGGHLGIYAMLGMAAMMGATLQAPLAALTAVLELTQNVNLILPGLFIIAIANVFARGWPWPTDSAFLTLMRARGLDYRNDPVAQALRRAGVASAMSQAFSCLPLHTNRAAAEATLATRPHWLVLENDEGQGIDLIPAADLLHYLQANEEVEELNLRDLPAKHRELARISVQADLQQALETLEETGAEALAVMHARRPEIYGVLTAEALETHYRR